MPRYKDTGNSKTREKEKMFLDCSDCLSFILTDCYAGLPAGNFIKCSVSPNGTYVVNAYLCDRRTTADQVIKAEVVPMAQNRYNPLDMLKTMWCALTDKGYCSLQESEDNCKTNLRSPNGKAFHFRYQKNVKGNRYRRQEEVFECKGYSKP